MFIAQLVRATPYGKDNRKNGPDEADIAARLLMK